ncbi:GrpB family protein [Staphylococcus xylosus]|uniref:GrpB family protein n=1 Tax=Staphylococcus TaxID=1279 RepID=UPI000E67F74A|nr:GrpB family protein [Staphylococcus xylosus]RIM76917.1 GrpB family protein [Staphylococcus xylosus]
MYSHIQPLITEDHNNIYRQQYQELSDILFNLLDTPVKSTHHLGGTSHFNYPTEPILDILVGVNNLHDITSLDEKRLNYEGFYRLHHPYKKKVVMAQFNNLIELKQVARLHIIQKNSKLYNDYLQTNLLLSKNDHLTTTFGEAKQSAAITATNIRDYENQKQKLFDNLTKHLSGDIKSNDM